jgi:tetratricopeptide (TPR) repeat protein
MAGALAAQPLPKPVGFPTSGSAQAQADFLQGVTALHHFEYEEANEAFIRARKADPNFAMAYWGEAMSYHQTLWRNEDVAAGRRALAGLAPTAASRSTRAGTATERGYLGAVEALFGEGDSDTRRRAYAEAMGRLHESVPDDPEAAAFYALALLGTTSRSLIGYVDTHEGHSASLAGSETQARVARILETVLRAHPEHPGALHYLLHNYDDPEHARLGIGAARTYAKVAAGSSHALHMPAHIFVQLGMWAEAEASDRDAFTASDAWVKRKGLPPAMRSYHALSWRQYELLQLGRFADSLGAIGEIAPVVKATGDLKLLSDQSSMRARYVVETRRWEVMANERNFGNDNELCAIGFSAARLHNAALAELARQALATRSTAPEEGDLRPAIAIMERQVAALIELEAGRREQAVAILRAATEAELKLPPPLGLPIPIKPAPELLGEVLLELERPGEALEPFGQALARNANRSLSVLGLARASSALGQADEARRHYRTLLANYDRADAGLAEIGEAREALEEKGAAAATATPPIGAASIALAIAAAVGLGFVVLRARGRTHVEVKGVAKREKRKARKRR